MFHYWTCIYFQVPGPKYRQQTELEYTHFFIKKVSIESNVCYVSFKTVLLSETPWNILLRLGAIKVAIWTRVLGWHLHQQSTTLNSNSKAHSQNNLEKRRREHSFCLFCTSKILPLKHLYFYKVLKIFYIRSGNLPCRNSTAYELRSNERHLTCIPPHNNHRFLNFYTAVAPRLFNRLPLELRIIRTSFMFNREIKKWLFNFDFSEVNNLIRIII